MSRVVRCAVFAAAFAVCCAARAEEAALGDAADAGIDDAGAPATGDGSAKDRSGGDEEGLVLAKSRHGAISLGLFAQAGFEYLPDESPGETNAFALHHAALVVEGSLASAHLDLLIAGDAAAGLVPLARRYGPGGEMRSSEGVPFLTDAAISWKIPVIGASMTIGRFVPSFGLTMPERPTRLSAVGYPLYIHGNAASFGRFRNLGIEVRADVVDWLKVLGGVFNGGVNSYADPDDYKDVLIGVSLRPAEGLEIRAASFFAFERSDLSLAALEEGQSAPKGAERHIQPIAEARYRNRVLDLLLGFALDAVHRANGDPRGDVLAFGATGHAGFRIVGDWLELAAGLDYFDPDAGGDGDDQLRVTAGPRFLLDDQRGQIRVSYSFDSFGGRRAMCETYLEEAGCAKPLPGFEPGAVPAEAKEHASTIVVQFGFDL